MMAVLKQLFMHSRQIAFPVLLKNLRALKCPTTQRFFSVTVSYFLKEIQVRTEKDVTIVEGCYIESDRKGKVLEPDNKEDKEFCSLCPNQINVAVKYTDVLILSQFLRADGCVLPQQVTGLCNKAQKRLQRLVHQAQRAGLMPEYRPDRRDGQPRTSLHSNYKWKKYNAYFDE